MEPDRMDPVELEVFLTLAEELHFGRTAERLGLSQPRVSQLVRTLERRVGGRLFDRTSRRVILNPLGDRLLRGVRPAFEDLRRCLAETRMAAHGLRVGFLGPYASTLDAPLSRFRSANPGCSIEMVQLSWIDVFGALRRSEIDLQVALLPVEQPDLVVGPQVASFPRMLAIAATHPLSREPELNLEHLTELRVIGPAPQVPPELARTFWPPEQAPSGRPILRGPVAITEPEMLGTVAHGDGVFLTTAAMPSHFSYPNVAFVPFTGMPDARVVLVWRRDNDKPKVLDLAAQVKPT